MTIYQWSEDLAAEMTTVRNKYLDLIPEIEQGELQSLAKLYVGTISHWIRAIRAIKIKNEDTEL